MCVKGLKSSKVDIPVISLLNVLQAYADRIWRRKYNSYVFFSLIRLTKCKACKKWSYKA